jgi:hypothetical protein
MHLDVRRRQPDGSWKYVAEMANLRSNRTQPTRLWHPGVGAASVSRDRGRVRVRVRVRSQNRDRDTPPAGMPQSS